MNNAGIYQFSPIEEVTEAEFHREFNTNVLGVLLAIREALKYFGPGGGSIINLGSVVSRSTPPTAAIYVATKSAVEGITRVLAKELGPRKIRVNSINPGVVETEGTHSAGVIGGDFERQAVQQTPLGRVGEPGDIAPVVVFLASDDARWVTGETLFVSGGMCRCRSALVITAGGTAFLDWTRAAAHYGRVADKVMPMLQRDPAFAGTGGGPDVARLSAEQERVFAPA